MDWYAYPVRAEEDGAEEAPVNGRLVHHDTILLVVAAVAGNGNNSIMPCR